jgi:peptidoglycan/LPS O-acetylase OafA/YrhL
MELKRHFLHRLESLRGIFALTVALHHSILMIQTHELAGKITRGLLCVLYGRGAVIFFFILSGVVLGQSLRRSQGGRSYLDFYIRRTLRIYPALIVSLIISSLMLAAFGFLKFSSPAATAYYESWYDYRLSLSCFVNNLFLVQYNLNNVTWTLLVEMIGSLLLPVMHLASNRIFSKLLLVLCLIAALVVPSGNFLDGALQFVWMFYVGYLIPLCPVAVWKYLGKNRLIFVLSVGCAILVCWLTPHFGNHAIPYALAASFLIASVYHLRGERLFAFLDGRLVRFYGRISYSFYLMHFIVLYAVAGLIFRTLRPGFLVDHSIEMSICLAILSISMATPISYLCYRFVEKTFIGLGKKLTGA